MARSPLLHLLTRLIRSSSDVIPSNDRLSRRDFLRRVSAASFALGAPTLLSACGLSDDRPRIDSNPTVAIVGGGFGGLSALHHLSLAGVRATLFEANSSCGGRVRSASGLVGDDCITELGAEFIDSNHSDVLYFVDRFKLTLLDTQNQSEAGLEPSFLIRRQRYNQRDVARAFTPIVERLTRDYQVLTEAHSYAEPAVKALDQLSLAEYLHELECEPFLKRIIEIAYVAEYGLDAGEQSALNLIALLGGAAGDGSLYGESDERYKIRGGNQLIASIIAEQLNDQIRTTHRLLAIQHKDSRYNLTFQVDGAGARREVRADYVIIAIPFTLLRDVEMQVAIPPSQKRAIAELGYGTNSKLFIGCAAPAWRRVGLSGDLVTDEAAQCVWDNSRLQGSRSAGLTVYHGGTHGAAPRNESAGDEARSLMPIIARGLTPLDPYLNGRFGRFHWPSYAWSRGSYSCYRPGQWSAFAGYEGRRCGNLLFAGEHCSREFQGFMNGALETGRLAAETLVNDARM